MKFISTSRKTKTMATSPANVAMRLAKTLGKAPRAIAESIIENLEYDNTLVSNVEIAGAGFINVKLTNLYWTNLLEKIESAGNKFGRLTIGAGKKANVEYVSVNPTGLLHLGHGRNACIGDTVANLFDWLGYDVTREYYFNNAGNQMKILADSIYARYMQLVSNPDFEFPENGYHGDYVRTIAADLAETYKNQLVAGSYQDLSTIRKFGESWCFDKIKKTLGRINVSQDVYFNEDSLYKEGKIKDTIDELTTLGLTYEKEGATWLSLSKMGLEDDRVIVKSGGEPTYRLPDIAYHREKYRRGFDLIVDLFGADHIATIPDVMAALRAFNLDTDKMKVLIHQFVTLTDNGEQVKMSKRTGKSYTLDDLLDEVGADVVRFFLLMRGINTHLEFDLSLAREQSDKNPVFYLQYAHARISSIFEKANETGVKLANTANMSLLQEKQEIKLIKQISLFPDMLLIAGTKSEPHVIAEYLRDLAAAFHVFYHECRIMGVDADLQQARLHLAKMAKYVLASGLGILGVAAPERM